eukprot:Hpha_TRINITY_DN15396_c6_g4::TRINITY_DN15396_c6_g4_i1::g.88914::m.88914/K04874/KCNA1; potassium voltage-gated channel Shaker-related subfamily A member 1
MRAEGPTVELEHSSVPSPRSRRSPRMETSPSIASESDQRSPREHVMPQLHMPDKYTTPHSPICRGDSPRSRGDSPRSLRDSPHHSPRSEASRAPRNNACMKRKMAKRRSSTGRRWYLVMNKDTVLGGWKVRELETMRDAFHAVAMQSYGHRDAALGSFELAESLRKAFPRVFNLDQAMRSAARILEETDTDRSNAISWNKLFCFLTLMEIDVEQWEMTEEEQCDIFDLLVAGEFPSSFLHPDIRQMGTPVYKREWLWAIMEQSASDFYRAPPAGSGPKWLARVAACMVIGSQVVVVVSALLLLIESLNDYQIDNGDKSGTSFTRGLEICCTTLFIIELVLRTAACPLSSDYCRGPMKTQKQFWKDVWTWCDVLAILPSLLEYSEAMGQDSATASLSVIRVLRLLKITRAMRVFKLGKYSKGIQMMGVAIKRARVALLWMLMMNVMAIILFGTFIYYAEKEDVEWNNAERKWHRSLDSTRIDRGQEIFFQDITDGMWWALVTLGTVGYGDKYPVTPTGKMVACFTMLVGIVLLAYPTTVLTTVFSRVQTDYQKKQRRAQERDRLRREIRQAQQAPMSPRVAGLPVSPSSVGRTFSANRSPPFQAPPLGVTAVTVGDVLQPTPSSEMEKPFVKPLLERRPSRPLFKEATSCLGLPRNSSHQPPSSFVSPKAMLGSGSGASPRSASGRFVCTRSASIASFRSDSMGHGDMTASPGGGTLESLVWSAEAIRNHLASLREEIVNLDQSQQLLEKQVETKVDGFQQVQEVMSEQLLGRFAVFREEILQTYRDCHEPADLREERERNALHQRIRALFKELDPSKAGELDSKFEQMRGRSDEIRLLRDTLQQLQKRVAAKQKKQSKGQADEANE